MKKNGWEMRLLNTVKSILIHPWIAWTILNLHPSHDHLHFFVIYDRVVSASAYSCSNLPMGSISQDCTQFMQAWHSKESSESGGIDEQLRAQVSNHL